MAIRNFQSIINKEEIFKRLTLIKNMDGSVETYFPNQINIDKRGIYFNTEKLNLTKNVYERMIVVNIKEAPISFQSVLLFKFYYEEGNIMGLNLKLHKLLGQVFVNEIRDYTLEELTNYVYLDYIKYVILLFYALIHHNSLDFSFFSICLTLYQMLNFNFNNNLIFGLLLLPITDSLLSIKHKFNPVFYYILRNYFLKKSLNENNCLNKLFLRQKGKHIYFKMNKNHIEEGNKKMSKTLFCKIYFSGVFSKYDIKANVFSRLSWIYEENHNILKHDILGKLFERQGYCKDFDLFKEIVVNSNVDSRIFKKNLKEKNIKVNTSLLRLNYYILLHLKGIYNSQTRFYRIKLIDFNYEKNVRINKYNLKKQKTYNKESIGSLTMTNVEDSKTYSFITDTETYVINNTNNLLLYKENERKKFNKESHKKVLNQDRKKIIVHKISKLAKVVKFLRKKIKTLSNEKKINKYQNKINKLTDQINNEIHLAEMINISIKDKEIWGKHKQKSFCLKLVKNDKKTTSSKDTILRKGLMNSIINKDQMKIWKVKNLHKLRVKKETTLENIISISHQKFGFSINASIYDKILLERFEDKIQGLIKTYKKDKKTSKTMSMSNYIQKNYVEYYNKEHLK
jgi:hypothetical protein